MEIVVDHFCESHLHVLAVCFIICLTKIPPTAVFNLWAYPVICRLNSTDELLVGGIALRILNRSRFRPWIRLRLRKWPVVRDSAHVFHVSIVRCRESMKLCWMNYWKVLNGLDWRVLNGLDWRVCRWSVQILWTSFNWNLNICTLFQKKSAYLLTWLCSSAA